MSGIDLSRLPAPKVIEELSFEEILQGYLDDLAIRDPELVISPSDPAHRVLEVAAFREFLLRQEFNDRLRSRMGAYASGADLDHLVFDLYGIERLVVEPGDPDANPPVPAVMESDAALLERGLLSLDGPSTAGGRDAYVFHARSASGLVKDAIARRGGGGVSVITVLSHEGSGVASASLLDVVRDYLLEPDRAPMNDDVVVQSATVVSYSVHAVLELESGPIEEAALEAAKAAVLEYVAEQHRLKRPGEQGPVVVRDAIIARLYVPGVRRVLLSGISADIDPGINGAAWCESVTVEVAE